MIAKIFLTAIVLVIVFFISCYICVNLQTDSINAKKIIKVAYTISCFGVIASVGTLVGCGLAAIWLYI